MPIIHDISSWANSLFEYSINLMTYGEIFIYDSANIEIQYSQDYAEIRRQWLVDRDPTMHIFWLSFSTGIECLCKSVLLKHECLNITKRNILNKYPIQQRFSSREAAGEYRNNIYGGVYRTASNKVIAKTNEWLNQQLEDNDITYNTEINTPTLGYIYNNSFKKLFDATIINNDELIQLEKGIETLTDIRRNVDSHIFLNSRTVGSIQSDIENIYLPITNLLIDIYFRTP